MDHTGYVLKDITDLTREENIELADLTSDLSDGESFTESTRRVALTWKSQAVRFRDLATDDEGSRKTDNEYERKALENWAAYVNSK